MRVKDLQQYLSNFTAANATGTRQGNAISNAVKSFNDAGFPAFTEKNKSNQDLTNVLVGPFASKQDIMDNQKTLNQIADIELGEVLAWSP